MKIGKNSSGSFARNCSKYFIGFLGGGFLLFTFRSAQAQPASIVPPTDFTVQVSPTTPGVAATYTFTFTVHDEHFTDGAGGNDHIDFDFYFPSGTGIPASATVNEPSYVLLNGVALNANGVANDAIVFQPANANLPPNNASSAQRVRVRAADTIAGNGSYSAGSVLTIQITSAANIINPGVAAPYEMYLSAQDLNNDTWSGEQDGVGTNSEPYNSAISTAANISAFWIVSQPYIVTSSTSIGSITATPSITTVNNPSAYTMQFDVGDLTGGGIYNGARTIKYQLWSRYFEYPGAGTNGAPSIPNINQSFLAPNMTGRSPNGKWRLKITDIEAGNTGTLNSWTITFPLSNGTNYSATRSPARAITDNSTTGITDSIIVANQNSTINGSISITLSITHTLNRDLMIYLIAPSGDYFDLKFTNGAITIGIPDNISTAQCSLNVSAGTFKNPQSIVTTPGSQLIRVFMPESQTVAALSTVQMKFPLAAGIINPDSANANNRVKFSSNIETAQGTSSAFTIVNASTITTPNVNLGSNVAGATSLYTVDFNVGNSGSLSGGTGIVYLTFPDNTAIPTTIDVGNITVNGVAAYAVQTTPSTRDVQVTVPNTIANNKVCNLVIAAAAGIKNPTTAATYTITARTSSETTPIPSHNYSIVASTVTTADVAVSPPSQSVLANYTINFRVGSAGALIAGSTTVTVVFPGGTVLSSITASDIRVNSTYVSSTPTIVGTSLTFVCPVSIDNNGPITIEFLNLRITNPLAGSYTLSLSSSVEPTAVPSNLYGIAAGSTVSIPDYRSSNYASGATSITDSVMFNVGSSGALFGSNADIRFSADFINVEFPTGTTVPATIATANITIKSPDATLIAQQSFNPNIVDVSGQTVTMYIPDQGAGAEVPFTNDNMLGVSFPNSSTGYIVGAAGTARKSTNGGDLFVDQNSGTTVNQLNGISFIDASNGWLAGAASYVRVTANGGTNWNAPGGALPAPNITLNDIQAISGTNTVYIATIGSVGDERVYKTINGGTNWNDCFAENPAGTVNLLGVSFIDATTGWVVGAGGLIYKTTVGGGVAGSWVLQASGVAIQLNKVFAQDANTAWVAGAPNGAAETILRTVNGGTNWTNISDITGTTVTFNDVFFSDANNGWAVGTNGVNGVVYKSVNGGSNWVQQSVGTVPTLNRVRFIDANTGWVVGNTGTILKTTDGGSNWVYKTKGGLVRVIFAPAAGITSPASAKSTYTARVSTNREIQKITSNRYTIISTTQLAQTSVTPTPATTNTTASYNIKFTTGANGALQAGFDTLYVQFPAGTTIPASMPSSSVKVNGVTLGIAPITTPASRRVKVVVPVDIATSTIVNFDFSPSAGIVNPVSAATYSLGDLHTNIQPNSSASPVTYTISTSIPVTASNVTVNPTTVSATASYSLSFTMGNAGFDVTGGTFTITFPNDTQIPSSIAVGNVTVTEAGTPQTLNSVTTTPGTRQVSVVVGEQIVATSQIVITFVSAAGIKNPTTGSNSYTLSVAATNNGSATSNTYTITNTSLSAATVTPNPTTVSTAATYTVQFSVGSAGALTAGTSTITLVFPSGTTVPASMAASNVTVNGTLLSTAPTTNPGTLTVTLTTPVSIANNGSITIVFNSSAGLVNPGSAGNTYLLNVNTSVETTPVASNAYSITTGNQVSKSTVTLSDPQRSASTLSSLVGFKVGTTGLAVAGTITITFPTGTTINTGAGLWAVTDVQVKKGAGAFSNATGVVINAPARSVTVDPAAALDPINAGDSLTVNLNIVPDANAIINPSTSGSAYTLQVNTTSEPTNVSSKQYTVTSLNSEQVTTATVTPNPNSSNQTAAYTIAFSTGANGAIAVGDSIIIVFDPSGSGNLTTVPSSIPNNSITVNGITCTVNPTVSSSGRRVAIATPVSVNASTAVNVVISSSGGIRNPNESSPTSHQISVKTNINITAVNSNNYTIQPSVSVTPATVTLNPSTVNTVAQYTIDFTNGTTALPAGGTITFVFPDNTSIPASISAGSVTVTVNGSGATVGTPTTTPGTRTVNIPITSAIAASGSFHVVLSSSGGIVNPTTANNSYTLTASVTSNGSAISNVYAITQSTVTAATVTPSPSTTNSTAQYTINFNVGGGGALSTGSNTITVQFPAGTTVPASIGASNITVNSTILGSSPTINVGTREVTMTTPVSIANNGAVSIVFSLSAGIQNPSSVGSNYSVNVKTSVEPTYIASNTYSITSATQVSQVRVNSISNAQRTATNGTYSIGFVRGNAGTLTVGVGTITIALPTGTGVTNGAWTLGDAQVDVNGGGFVNANATGTAATNTVVVTTPTTASASSPMTVKLNVANNRITNPSSSGSNYTLTVQTSVDVGAVTSTKYTITSLTAEQVSVATVTPNPNTSSTPAGYTIAFNTNATSGAIINGDSIIVVFPAGTTVPSSMVASNITVNGTGCSVGPTINQSQRRVAVVSPVAVSSGGSISLVFNSSAGLVNPTAGAAYTVNVSTNINTSARTSNTYTISNSTNVTPATVTPNPTTVNTTAQYTISFTNGDVAINSATDSLTVTFPSNTSIPASIANSSVTVNGSNPTEVITIPASRKVKIRPSVTVSASVAVTLVFSSSAGLLNPSTSGTSYQLSVHTTGRPTDVSSNVYTITQSSVTTATVTVSPSTTNSIGQYTIVFSVGAGGGLSAGSSTITIVYPSGTILPASMAPSSISVNSVDLSVSPTVTVPTRTVTFTTPVSVSNNGAITTVFKSSANVQNPSIVGNYTLNVSTSIEPQSVASNNYSITGPGQVSQVKVNSISNAQRNATNGTYSIGFVRGNAGTLTAGVGTITIVLPAGTGVTNGAWTSGDAQVDVNGGGFVNANASGTTATNTVVVTTPTTASASTPMTVKLNVTNNRITNPSSAGSNYTLTLETSVDVGAVTSSKYTITSLASEQVSVATVTPSPNTSSSPAAYTIAFNTNATSGALLVGDSVVVVFPSGTTVPSSMTAANISINGTGCTIAPTISQSIRRIAVVTPVAVSSGGSISLVFNSSAGLVNPTAGVSYTVNVSTNINTTAVTSNQYTIQNSVNVTPATVTLNPTTVNTTSQYTISFTNGNLDITAATDSITITFPSNTTIPASIVASSVTVNGSNPTQVLTIPASRIVRIRPNATILASAPVTIIFSSSAGIVNPSTAGSSYQLSVHTTARPTDVASNTYTITASTVTTATVTVVPTVKDLIAQYTIAFNVGASGALTGGSSTMTITLPVGTIIGSAVSGTPGNTSVNATAATSVSVAGQQITVTVPASVNVANNGAVTVVFSNAANMIQNPSIAQTYNLNVHTSAEPTDVASNTYTITNTTTVSQSTVSLASGTSNSGTLGRYTIRFTLGSSGSLTAGSGTITITFPSGTTLGSAVNGTPANTKVKKLAGDAYNNCSTVSVAGLAATLTTPIAFNNSDSAYVFFDNLANMITNPATAGSNKTITIHTSKEQTDIASNPYTITSSTQVTAANVAALPDTGGMAATYTINFSTGANGPLIIGDKITIVFPNNTTVPASISASNVQVNSTPCSVAPVTIPASRQVTVTIPVAVSVSSSINLVFLKAANIVNPTTYNAGYTLTANTNIETTPTTSNGYLIRNTDGSLPVELATFEVLDGKRFITLKWTTESEVENAAWKIERSENENGPFSLINQLPGKGSTTQSTNYSFNDSQVKTGLRYYYRLVDISFSGQVTYHVVKSGALLLPTEFGLEQNYPNPFNPTTKIEYSLPEKSPIKIVIYNMLGQEVKTLIEGEVDLGYHIIEWNGKNNAGLQTAAGIYFYRIQANHFTKVRKMLLLK